MMKVPVLYAALLLSSLGLAGGLFVPEELPTLLSFLYTNIPPIFKGIDSRLGIGFRVGPNADFQVQVELGPQTRTQKLGPDAEGSNKKRQVLEHQLNKIPVPGKKRKKKKKTPVPETPMGWLQTWKNSVNNNPQEEEVEEIISHSQPIIDYDTVMHLQQLYKKEPSVESEAANDTSIAGSEVTVINDEELKWDVNMMSDAKEESNVGVKNDQSVNIDPSVMRDMMIASGIKIMNDQRMQMNPSAMSETMLASGMHTMNDQSVKRGPSVMSDIRLVNNMAVLSGQGVHRDPPSILSSTSLPSGMTLINYYQGVKKSPSMMSDTMIGSDMTIMNDQSMKRDPPNGMSSLNYYQGIKRGQGMVSSMAIVNDQSAKRYPNVMNGMSVINDQSVKRGPGVMSDMRVVNYQAIRRGPTAVNYRRVANDRIWGPRPPRVWKVIRF